MTGPGADEVRGWARGANGSGQLLALVLRPITVPCRLATIHFLSFPYLQASADDGGVVVVTPTVRGACTGGPCAEAEQPVPSRRSCLGVALKYWGSDLAAPRRHCLPRLRRTSGNDVTLHPSSPAPRPPPPLPGNHSRSRSSPTPLLVLRRGRGRRQRRFRGATGGGVSETTIARMTAAPAVSEQQPESANLSMNCLNLQILSSRLFDLLHSM